MVDPNGDELRRSIVGTWRYAGGTVRDGGGRVVGNLFGPKGIGLLLLGADGRMLVSLCDGRTDLPAGSGREFAAFSGNYRVDEDVIVIQVDVSTIPAMLGTEQRRRVVRFENGRMTVHPPRVVLNGVEVQQELSWERIS